MTAIVCRLVTTRRFRALRVIEAARRWQDVTSYWCFIVTSGVLELKKRQKVACVDLEKKRNRALKRTHSFRDRASVTVYR